MTRSNRISLGIVAALAIGALSAQTAEAGGRRYRSYCGPSYCAPVVRTYCPPVYAAPVYAAPVVYRPAVTYAAPVVYSPAPVVYAPAPVVYRAPVRVVAPTYCAPYRSSGFSFSFGWGRSRGCW